MKNIISVLLILACSLSFYGHDDIQNGYHFTANKGQFDAKVRFHSRLKAGNMFLEKDRFTFDFYSSEQLELLNNKKSNNDFSGGSSDNAALSRERMTVGPAPIVKKHSYSMIFEGYNPDVAISSEEQIGGYKNYFIGNDKSKWAENVSSYRAVNYTDIYNNIDLEIYSAFNWMKYDFKVAPGGNPNDILINYDGVDRLQVENNDLVIKLSTGDVREVKLLAYQEIGGKRVDIPCQFKVEGNNVSFDFPDGYDQNEMLIIDPVWIFSTLTGSTEDNWGFTSTYDSQGNLYAAGISFGTGYPTTVGAYDDSYNGDHFDISVTKFSADGTSLIYSTYLGGNDAEAPHSLVNDSQDNLILLGSTSSTDYPTTTGAYDETFNSGWAIYANMWGYAYNNGTDIVLTKFDINGALDASTVIGGTDNEGINESMVYNYSDQIRGELVLDDNDDIYVCSSVMSDDFPVTDGSTINNGGGFGSLDAVVFKMNNNLDNLDWATYLGGSDNDAGYSIRYSTGNVYVCGGTESNDFGADAGSIGPTYGGSWDGYLASFNSTTGASVAKTYLGTGSYDQSFILEIDGNNDVYVVGQSLGGYPVVNATYSNANSAQFIHKLSSDFTTTIYSTVFGNGSLAFNPANQRDINISPTAFLVDNCGNVYVTGWGGAANSWTSGLSYEPAADGHVNNMPITGDAIQSTTDGSDFYFFVMEKDAQSLLYGTYFGDNGTVEHTDGGTSRFDPDGIVYQSVCAACGLGGDFPTTPGVWAENNGSGGDCNMGAIKFEMNFQGVEAMADVPADITLCSTDYTVTYNSSGTNPQHEWLFGDGVGTSTDANPTYTYADTGSYVITYIAHDPASCNVRDTAYFNVDIIQAPTFDATFNLPVIPPCSDPASVTVNATVSGVGIDSLEWDMGDGNVYTDVSTIAHDYTAEGIYPIEVIAWDLTCNFSDTIRDTLNFLTTVLTATATAPADTTLCSSPPYDIDFSSNGSTPSQFWDFDDGNNSSAQNPTNTFAASGLYNVMFVAIDPNTCNEADTVYFNVNLTEAPTFNASFNVPVIPPCSDPASVTVNADITGTGIDSVEWNMGDGTIYTDITTIAHDYTAEGIYPIEVIAWDLTCNYSDTINDTLHFITTTLDLAIIDPEDTTMCSSPPFDIDFTATGGTPHHYWDFGDGNNSTSANPTNTYATTGTFNVMYVAIDSNTCNIADTAYFDVDLNQAAVFDANFNVPVIPPCSDPAAVTVNADITGTGIDSVEWDMGDGTVYTDILTIAHDYTAEGTYPIEVIAWDLTCNFSDTIRDTLRFNTANINLTIIDPEDTTMCSSPPFDIDFTATGGTPHHYWDFGDGNTSSLQDPTNTYATTGTYNVMYVAIDSSTCNIADTAYFDVDLNQAAVFDATFNLPVIPPCSDPTSVTVNADITGTAIDSVEWNMGDGTIYTDITTIAHDYTAEGIYPIEVIAWDLTCNFSDTINDTLHFITTMLDLAIIDPEDTTMCTSPPFNIDFTATSGTPDHFWNFGDGNTSTEQDPTNTYATTGIYNVMYVAIDSNTCNISDTAYFDVELNQAAVFDATFNLPVIPPCSDPASVTINADISGTAIDSVEWNMGDGTIYTDVNTIAHDYTAEGIYPIEVIAWDLTCNFSDTIRDTFHFITDSTLTSAYAPEDTTLCTVPPFSIDFSAQGNVDHSWDFGDGNTSTLANPTNVYADSGSYVVTYISIDSNTCNIADTATFNVNLIQAEQFAAELSFTPPPPCGIDSMLVELYFSGTSADSLIWDMGNGTVFNSDSVEYYYTEPGIYNLSMTAFDFTCNITETISEEVPFLGNFITEFAIPNVFTPNGDNENDLLTFVNIDGSEIFRLTVFNRWGRKIYYTEDAMDHWDGVEMNGNEAPEGIYYFEIIFTDMCSDTEKVETGFVHLMR